MTAPQNVASGKITWLLSKAIRAHAIAPSSPSAFSYVCELPAEPCQLEQDL